MKRACLLCDPSTPAYLAEELRVCVEDFFQIQSIGIDQLSDVTKDDLLIYARESIDALRESEAISRILLHGIQGGAILALNPGLSANKPHELNLLFSARPLRQLPYGELCVRPTKSELARGFAQAELWDIPCFFDFSAFDDSEVIAVFDYGAREYPLAWHRSWFLGHVYCAAIGMTRGTMKAYRPILRNIVQHVREGEVHA